ncbi:acetoin reductase [Piedraia hortae CBS 480.64]|uniref:Acetoin reductase n=1 Tax=Piedraia hortae CBS 480.64 TaxID=1314780 RepID=A0A6A7C2Y2_9PEZI|nr:acetoin reductase [Piedraia hortae CBS 480.64]
MFRPRQLYHRISLKRNAAVRWHSVIVTGSSRGIGKAIALRLARDGYNVCVNDVKFNASDAESVAEEIRSLGRKSVVAIADVTSLPQVEDMIRTSVRSLGELNTMVANAGIAQVKALLELTPDDTLDMFRVNVLGVQNCFQAAAKQMIAQGNGSSEKPNKLLAASSIAGFRPYPLHSHYCASKAAVKSLTEGYALELAEYHITANAYAPGVVATPLWEGIDTATAERKGWAKGEALEGMRKKIVLGRISVPNDVAKLVSFLASRDSDYITGQTQIVDGGIVWA